MVSPTGAGHPRPGEVFADAGGLRAGHVDELVAGGDLHGHADVAMLRAPRGAGRRLLRGAERRGPRGLQGAQEEGPPGGGLGPHRRAAGSVAPGRGSPQDAQHATRRCPSLLDLCKAI